MPIVPIIRSTHTSLRDDANLRDYGSVLVLQGILENTTRRSKDLKANSGSIVTYVDCPSRHWSGRRYPIVMFADFNPPLALKKNISSFIAVIRPIRVTTSNLDINENGELLLKESDIAKPVDYIISDEKRAFQEDLKAHRLRGAKCTSLAFFPDITKAQFLALKQRIGKKPRGSYKYIFQDSRLPDILYAIGRTTRGDQVSQFGHCSQDDFRNCFQPLELISPLEANIKNLITQPLDPGLGGALAKQEVVIHGAGGTGKTVLLLRALRTKLDENREAKALVLSYNHALKVNLRRIFSYLGYDTRHSHNASIQFKTLDSHLIDVIKRVLKFDDSDNGHLLDDDRKCLKDYIDKLTCEINKKDPAPKENRGLPLRQLLKDKNLWFDILCIDEAQDVSEQEKALLERLYQYGGHIVAALGHKQNLRLDEAEAEVAEQKWLQPGDHKFILPELQVSRRMPPRLATLLRAFAEKTGLKDWRVEPSHDPDSSQLFLLKGSYTAYPNLHATLLPEIVKPDTQHFEEARFDMLVCTLADLATETTDKKNGSTFLYTPPAIVSWLHEHSPIDPEQGNNASTSGVLDLIDPKVRRQEIPLNSQTLNRIRVVPYDSCRGLEGSIVILDCLDKFAEARSYRNSDVARLIAIALSRTTKRLIITFERPDSEWARIISEVARQYVPEMAMLRDDDEFSDESLQTRG